MKIRNTFIIFLVSGFWHGANWTFIIWGALNALYFLPLLLLGKNRQNLGVAAENKIFPSIKEIFQIGFTFTLTVLAWVFFRAENVTHAINYLKRIFDKSFFSLPEVFPSTIIGLVVLFISIEWLQREKNHALEINGNGLLISRPIRWGIYLGLIILIFSFGGSQQEFIYFQF